MVREKFLSIKKRIEIYRKPKIFGIGLNKTGTTSLKTAMKELGFSVGYQPRGEGLIIDWKNRNFNNLISYCYTAQFFQDVPFSLPFTYVILDHAFPKSKFILTVRDNSDQWYRSITKFHSKLWGKDNQTPNKEQLRNAEYLTKGWPWEFNRANFNTPINDLYNREQLINYYDNHYINVMEYFRHKQDNLLVLNVAEPDSYTSLCNFLGVKGKRNDFPWKNKTIKNN